MDSYPEEFQRSLHFTGNGTSYTFTFDTINKRFRIFNENGGEPINPLTGHLYILGEAQGNSWDPSVGVEMNTADGNVFTAQVTFNGEWSEEDANVSYFSFTTKLSGSSEDWNAILPYRLSPVSEGNYWVTSTTLGQTIPLNPFGENVDVSFRIPAGTYTLTVDLNALTCVITREGGSTPVAGKGWPGMYGGVMLQGFYWDSYKPTRWATLTDNVQELASTSTSCGCPTRAASMRTAPPRAWATCLSTG